MPRKDKTRLSTGKFLATFLWDCKGISLVDFLREQGTVNAAYYCQLLDEVKLAHRRKRRDMPVRNDNAP